MPKKVPRRAVAPKRARKPKKAVPVASSEAVPPIHTDPTGELIRIATRLPIELLRHLDSAIQSGRWLCAVWHVELQPTGNLLKISRTAHEFPDADHHAAVEQLTDSLRQLLQPAK